MEEQLDLLICRGLECQNRELPLHCLGHLNYYRLAGYWLPFESDHATHQFKAGTRFEDIMNLYIFDRELRLLVLDAIERIEVSIRTGLAYHLSHQYGPHTHLDSSIFKTPSEYWNYEKQKTKLAGGTDRSREIFIQHHRERYDEPLPPLWVSVEVMTLGQLSKWYANLRKREDRNAIAHRYDLDEGNLCSFLHHLTTIRNLCAHHSRLWNRKFTFTFKLPNKRPSLLVKSFNTHDRSRIYNTLTTLAWMMDCISPEHHWKLRLKRLLERHGVSLRLMGFPEGFTSNRIWATTWSEPS